jgi:heme o synthase
VEASRAVLEVPGVKQVVADYVTLTKPRVQSLLLLTTVTTMYVAGDPSVGLVALTVIGGSLSAGGAGAVNHAYDRDIDARMRRTANRPVASGRVSARAAVTFGLALAALSFVQLSLTVNVLAASLALAGFVGYVGVYTMWLKRTTPQNIVIGGAAGAIPPLVGWAAVTGHLDPTALYLFAIVFYWTPPHFWALSLLMKDEYARVGVPMPAARADADPRRLRLLRRALRARGGGPGRGVPRPRPAAQAARGPAQRVAHLPVLPRLPGRAVLRDGGRRPTVRSRRPMDRRLARKNLRTALVVSVIMLLMFALTFVAALVYTT